MIPNSTANEYEEKCHGCQEIFPLKAIHLDFDGQFRCRPCSLGGEFNSIAQANRFLSKYSSQLTQKAPGLDQAP